MSNLVPSTLICAESVCTTNGCLSLFQLRTKLAGQQYVPEYQHTEHRPQPEYERTLVKPNKYKAQAGEISQNRNFYLSLVGTAISVATLIITLTK